MLNKSGDSEHSCLIPDLRGDVFNFSPLKTMLVVHLSHMVFILLTYVPSVPILVRVFIISRYFQNASSQTQNAPSTCNKQRLCFILVVEFGGAGTGQDALGSLRSMASLAGCDDPFPSEIACLGKGEFYCLNRLLIKAQGQGASQDFPQSSAQSAFIYAISRLQEALLPRFCKPAGTWASPGEPQREPQIATGRKSILEMYFPQKNLITKEGWVGAKSQVFPSSSVNPFATNAIRSTGGSKPGVFQFSSTSFHSVFSIDILKRAFLISCSVMSDPL